MTIVAPNCQTCSRLMIASEEKSPEKNAMGETPKIPRMELINPSLRNKYLQRMAMATLPPIREGM